MVSRQQKTTILNNSKALKNTTTIVCLQTCWVAVNTPPVHTRLRTHIRGMVRRLGNGPQHVASGTGTCSTSAHHQLIEEGQKRLRTRRIRANSSSTSPAAFGYPCIITDSPLVSPRRAGSPLIPTTFPTPPSILFGWGTARRLEESPESTSPPHRNSMLLA